MSATTDYANMDGVPSQTSGVSPLKAADWNTFVRDNFDAIKFGHLVTTVAARPTGIANGTMIYETDTRSPMLRSNGAWVPAGLAVCGTTSDLSGFTASHEGLIAYETTNDRYRRYTGAAWAALVTTSDLTDSSVTEAKIADSSVTSAKIANGAIVDADVNSSAAIAKTKIAGTALTTADTGTVTSTIIADDTIVNADINSAAAIAYSKLALSGSIVNADVSASAAIADSKLATISTAGKVANSATTATNANTASAIVARDASGNFSAGTITASLSGNATTATGLSSGGNTFAWQSVSAQWYTGSNLRANGTVYGVSGDFSNLYSTALYSADITGTSGGTAVFDGSATFNSSMYAPNMSSTTSAANMRRNTSSPYGIVYSTSSRRVKTNIEQYIVDPAKLLSFRGVTYNSLCEADDPSLLFVGFIAEEAEEAGLSEFVDYDDNGVVQNFNYAHFTAALLELCKYQEKRIDDLEARLSALEAR